MSFFHALGILLGAIAVIAKATLQEDFGATTGHLVKNLVKTNWLLQRLITEEINSGHDYVNAALLERIKLSDNDTKVEDIRASMQTEYVNMLNIDQDCASAGGMLWLSNRALRAAEKYREIYLRADNLEICGWQDYEQLNKICRVFMDRYKRAVSNIENNVFSALERVENIFDHTMGCLRVRYNSLLRSIEDETF